MADRWFILTEDHLRAVGHGMIVDAARGLEAGGIDPIQEALDNATARVLRAVAPGNDLDADPRKIPGSFKGVAIKLALFDLMERIGQPLLEDQVATKRDITSDLNRTADHKLKVELPDNPAASGTMQATGMQVEAIAVPRRKTGRDQLSGL